MRPRFSSVGAQKQMAGASGIVSRSECNWLQTITHQVKKLIIFWFNLIVVGMDKVALHVQSNPQFTKLTYRYQWRYYILTNSIVDQHLPHWLHGQCLCLSCIQIKHLLNSRCNKQFFHTILTIQSYTSHLIVFIISDFGLKF